MTDRLGRGELGRRRARARLAKVLRLERSLEAMFLASQFAGLIVSVALARSIGPTGRGTITILAMWGVILGWLGAFSLDKAIIVMTKEEHGQFDAAEALAFCRSAVLTLTVPMVILAVLVGHAVFRDQWYTVLLVVISAATAQGEIFAGWLLARGKRATYIAWRLLQPSSYVLSTVVVVVALRNIAASTRTLAVAVGLTMSVVGPVLGPLLVPRSGPVVRSGIAKMRDLLRFAIAAQAANILQYLNGRLDLLVLPFLVSTGQVGYYAVGAGAGQIPFLLGAAAAIRGITGQSRKTDAGGLLLVAAACASIIVTAPFVIPLVFGNTFRPSVVIAEILAGGALVNYALQSTSGRLLGINRPWDVAIAQGIGAIGFGCGIATFPTLRGAAWSSVASFAASAVAGQLLWQYRTGHRSTDPEATPG
ncbi:MAG: hypothetical protein QOG97_2671 [Acidimicrobiaceae bacterium]|nr:hypothetical protein [Acidimicrobiaceae bacterium]MDQ1442443.1 hypothetical protein [Acidimicrobiaceae bacterium]